MTAPLYVDGISTSSLLAAQGLLATQPAALSASLDSADRYWSTPPRAPGDPSREVLQIDLSVARLVNYITVAVPHFPHTVTAEYKDPHLGVWLPFQQTPQAASAPPSAVSYSIFDSVPARVDALSTSAGTHPQHQGAGHWVPVSWAVVPTTAQSMRLVFQRVPTGQPPVGPTGQAVPYCLGAQNIQFGYRVHSQADIPRYGDVTTYVEDFASSADLLGSRVVYSLHQDSARNMLSPSATGARWQCDPQPISYAVVCLYADVRDAQGNAQVVDRWYVEPTTVGVVANLYYSNDDPVGSFQASDQALAYPIVQLHGTSATPEQFPPTPTAESLGFSHVYPSYVDVDNTYLQFDPGHPWWVALQINSTFFGADGVTEIVGESTSHPILSLGPNSLGSVPGGLQFVTEHGEVVSVPLDPQHVRGSRYQVVVVYSPDGAGDYPAGLTLIYQLGTLPPVQKVLSVNPLVTRPTVVRLGGYPDSASPGVPGISMRAFILKTENAPAESVATFLRDPQAYVRRAPFEAQDTHTTDNSILRMEPWRSDAVASPAGLLGGTGDVYAGLTWSPVMRDYTLKKGFLFCPPTFAKYWKFEFTRLVPEHYNSFIPIRREVKIFTSDVVRQFSLAQPSSSNPADAGAGVSTMLGLGTLNRYADAISVLRGLPDTTRHTPTEVLYATNPSEAQRIQQFGWVWGFQPWHIGASAPRFVTTTRHVYETITVNQETRVAYFVGIRLLRAYRVDYLASDDTAQYVDLFHDQQWIQNLNGVMFDNPGLVSLSGAGTAVSKVLSSFQPVRAIQFASQQSDSIQVLPNDNFHNPYATDWNVYGSAVIQQGDRQVTVLRNWVSQTYGKVETNEISYGNMEGDTYIELEGALPGGVTGGGIQSNPVTVSDGGRLYAALRVLANQPLTAPVVVQLIAAQGDVVLAQDQRSLVPGEEAKFFIGYTPGSVQTPLTYTLVEGTSYASLNMTTYGTHESVPVSGPIYVRAAQLTPTNDIFTVKRLSLFDEAIQWAFSVDAGTTWFDAYGVRNNPSGVLTFPVLGTKLQWQARIYRAGLSVSALAIRPWYNGLLGSRRPGHGMDMSGPNRSVVDQYAPIERDPMWRQWDLPIPSWWFGPLSPDVVAPSSATGPVIPIPPPPPPPVVLPGYQLTYPLVYPPVVSAYLANYRPTY